MLRSLLAVPLLILALACGPAAISDSGPSVPPAVAQADPQVTATPEATSTPVPTKPPYVPPTPRPTKPPAPNPTSTPPPSHPDGLEGCESVVIFHHEADLSYQQWCGEQIVQQVIEECSTLPTTAEQRQCGEDVVEDYDSIVFRHGAMRCVGITATPERQACVTQAGDDFGKAYLRLIEAWEKVRIGADGATAVLKATEDVVACLEADGFDDGDMDLLFQWQIFETPADGKVRDSRLSQQEKDLRADLIEPSRDCGKQHGLFEAQEEAWTAELERLEEEEPLVVAELIREGMLDALRKPGVLAFLTGERS